MAFDVIVFTQEELYAALSAGNTSIGLCDNTFILPLADGIHYTAIGNVSASAQVCEKEFKKHSVVCDGFSPRFAKSPAGAVKKQPSAALLPAGSVSSYMSSYLTSYFMTSYFMTSYMYEYEYEYRYKYKTSFGASYSASFAASYSSSFASSFAASFFHSFGASFRGECRPENISQHSGTVCVMVNGYGINLI